MTRLKKNSKLTEVYGAGGVARSSKPKPSLKSKSPAPIPKPAAKQSPAPALSEPADPDSPFQLTPSELDRRSDIVKRLDPKGFGILNPANFEGDDIYLLLAPVNGKDGKAATVPVAARVPGEIKQAIDYLLMQKCTPFQSITEFAVSAFVLMLRNVADLHRGNSRWRDAVRVLNIGMARARAARRQADIAGYLEETEKSIRVYLDMGHRMEAIALWSEVKEEIEAMDDGAWHAVGMKWLEQVDPLLDPPEVIAARGGK